MHNKVTGNKSEKVKTYRRNGATTQRRNDRDQLQINMGHNTQVRRCDKKTRRREFVGAKNSIAKWIKQHKESPMKQKVNEPVGGGLSACSKKNCARTAANMRKPKKKYICGRWGPVF